MSKKPKIKHEYHRGKDKMEITIRGYSLRKITREEIIENLIKLIERIPDRLVANARKSKGKAGKKAVRGQQKVSKLVKIGD